MKADRFLIFILAGIGLLATLAVAIYFFRQGSQGFTSDATPQGVVQNYLVAVGQENYDLAYQYLAQIPEKPSRQQFQQYFLNFNQSMADTSVQVGETNVTGSQASVALVFLRADSGAFGSVSRQPQAASLVLEDGAWKISQFPYPFWDYSWGQALPAVKPPPPAVPAYP